MPKSRGRKKTKKPHVRPVVDENKIVFRKVDLGGNQRAEVKEAILSAARTDVEKFPYLINQLLDILKKRTPDGILATFAFYGTRAAVKSNGETRPLLSDIQQHHVELLQGIVLTLPFDEWGHTPSTSDVMQTMFDMVPKVADTFFKRRLLAQADEIKEDRRALMSLQEKIRLHTQAVRNWGYISEVKKICREVYVPLDAKLNAVLGFSFTDILDVAEAILTEIEQRSSRHTDLMVRIFTAKDTKTLVERYFNEMPGITGSPDEFYKIIPPGTPREGAMGALMSHADLRHPEIMAITAAEVAGLTGKDAELIEKVLQTLSITPGELCSQKIEHLFLDNPVWARPGISLGDAYLFVIPQAIFSHINEIMWGVAKAAKMESDLSDRRAAYLEDKTEAIIQAALPTAKILKNAKWIAGHQQFETDVIAVVDRTLFLAEAKSHRLTPLGLRGEPERLKRHLTEMVIESSIQSERLAKHIISARSGNEGSITIARSLGLDPENIDQIIRVSLILDDLSVLSASEDELDKAGLIPEGHNLAPSLHISDLCCIADILDREIPFLHYFSERFYFQKHFNIIGDELDFLGMYLLTGFNLGAERTDLRDLVVIGMSDVVDKYYNGIETGLSLKKPVPALHRVYKEIIHRLAERKPNGWTTIGIHLLNSASPQEQAKVERGLEKLRESATRKNPRPSHNCFMQIIPPLNRKATVAFFVHRDADAHLRRANMEHFATQALEREEVTTCVLFAKNVDNWTAPYEAVLFAHKLGGENLSKKAGVEFVAGQEAANSKIEAG